MGAEQGDSEQQAEIPGEQDHKADHQASCQNTGQKAQNRGISSPAIVVLPVVGGQNGLHGPGCALIKIQNQVGGILYQVKHCHTAFAAHPYQYIVADKEKYHLVQILD